MFKTTNMEAHEHRIKVDLLCLFPATYFFFLDSKKVALHDSQFLLYYMACLGGAPQFIISQSCVPEMAMSVRGCPLSLTYRNKSIKKELDYLEQSFFSGTKTLVDYGQKAELVSFKWKCQFRKLLKF